MLNVFSLQSVTKQGYPLLPFLFNIVLKIEATAITQRKPIMIVRERSNFLFSKVTDCVENFKESINQLLEPVNLGHKMQGQH